MAPIIHCVRHAEGWHNISEENMQKVHDPSLTPLGREQALRLSDKFPNMDQIDLAMSSPLRRTIQTAFLGFEPVLRKKKMKLHLLPRAQETSAKKGDTESEIGKLEREFGGERIDVARVPEEWNSNEGFWAEDSETVKKRAKEVRQFLKKQDAKHLLLVTHGGFLHYLTETLDEAPDGEGSTNWENTEYRSFEFDDEKSAHMSETKESKERRKDKPLSGADAKEPDI